MAGHYTAPVPRDTPPEPEPASLDAVVGPDRAAALRAELTAAGFAAVRRDELDVLRREAAGYRRLQAIALSDDT